MSYDIYLELGDKAHCVHCGRGPDQVRNVYDSNMTSNVSGIWFRALSTVRGLPLPPGWDDLPFGGAPHPLGGGFTPGGVSWNDEMGAFGPLAGITGFAAAEVCLVAADEIEANPEKYKKFEPENGWGDAKGAAQFLRDLGQAWLQNPHAKLRVSR